MCPHCGSVRKLVMLAMGGELKESGGMVGFVHDSPAAADKAHSISVHTPLGARSEAHLQPDGTVRVAASGLPDVGTRGEAHVKEILTRRMRTEGTDVEAVSGAVDGRGEDGLLRINDRRLTLQVTSVPSCSTFWRDAAQGSTSTEVANAKAVEWLREAVLNKSSVDDRQGTILAIDARHAGVLADAAVADAYRRRYPSPTTEYGFAQVWVVGPTPSHCTRL